jgi:hypothetical protein
MNPIPGGKRKALCKFRIIPDMAVLLRLLRLPYVPSAVPPLPGPHKVLHHPADEESA